MSSATLLDECKSLQIRDLKKLGYLENGYIKSGVINWNRTGIKTGSISIRVSTINDNYIELDYKCNDVQVNYRIELISKKSNLDKGVIWYFVCPYTRKRCRKLHLVDTYFYHRSAFPWALYEKQSLSKRNRWLCDQYEKLFGVDQAYEKIYSKHFKKTYNGKPTKRYLALLKQVEVGEGISEEALLMY